ncbi:MAG: phosphoenolpyruvate synthase [archaeon]|nr:phosphoenolpyruvate synthase [archaeon]
MIEKEVGEVEEVKGVKFVVEFNEISKNSVNIAGGKGANLAEMFNLGMPVPKGFVVTTQAYDYFIREAGLREKIINIFDKIDFENTTQLEESAKKIRQLIETAEMPEEMENQIREAYKNLSGGKIDAKLSKLFHTIDEPTFVAVRSSANAEDSELASFAGQGESFLNVKGGSDLIEAIKKCFSSLFTGRSIYYRNKNGFEHGKTTIAVIVQKMIDSQKSGVIFTKDPSGRDENVVIEAVFGLGEGIVSGQITPDNYAVSRKFEILQKTAGNKKIALTRDSAGKKETVKLSDNKSKEIVLTDNEIKKLAEYALELEEHYGKPQDIEFAIENNEIFIVQTRPITTLGKNVGEDEEIKGEVILSGLAASPGIASGKVKIVYDLKDLDKVLKGDILVTKMTNPDMVVTMQRANAIVTDEGGLTAHAAIVSREMGIPCVVGTDKATEILKDNTIITVDGFTGKIYQGKVSEDVEKEIMPVSEIKTKTKIKVMVDLPSFAERASQTGIRDVGLTRIEGIISESGKHPNYFLENNSLEKYEEIVFDGINKIAQYFDSLWIRTSDIRTDEFMNLEGSSKEKEINPMLGMHGIRYGIKNKGILISELKALKRVSVGGKKIGILLPQIISVEEVKEVRKILQEIDFMDVQVGVMIETPAAVEIINELCEEGIDFISFGTNDLTQYTLAIDRGNEQVQFLYNEMHPAVLNQIKYVLRACKRFNVETSICGQAGSKKEMVKFLVEKGIDSISVNADSAEEISKYIKELESSNVRN